MLNMPGNLLSIWQPQAETLRRKLRQPFLFLADEFYLKADLPFPPIKEYGDFPQIENGVGMVPLFMKEAARLLRESPADWTVSGNGCHRRLVVWICQGFSGTAGRQERCRYRAAGG